MQVVGDTCIGITPMPLLKMYVKAHIQTITYTHSLPSPRINCPYVLRETAFKSTMRLEEIAKKLLMYSLLDPFILE